MEMVQTGARAYDNMGNIAATVGIFTTFTTAKAFGLVNPFSLIFLVVNFFSQQANLLFISLLTLHLVAVVSWLPTTFF